MSRSDFLQEYVEEVREHLQELESSLLVLEREGSDKEEISQIFRAAHSIKGASSYMGFEGLAHLTHELESLISGIQAHSRPVTAKGVNLLLECVDFISRAVGNLEIYREELPLPPSLLDDLYDALSMKVEPAPSDPTSEPEEKPSLASTPESMETDALCQEEKPVEVHGVSGQGQEEIQENELAHIRIFLSSFRDQFWELVNAVMLSPEMVLAESDVERSLDLIDGLIDLSGQENFDQLVELLEEWQKVLRESHQGGRIERESYSDLLNTYAKGLQEILPSLELPFLAFGSEEAPQERDATPEEEDKELLGIFVDTFQQNFSGLRSLASPEGVLSEADLVRAREIIGRLISSARYMDYDQVIHLLKEFEVSLLESHESGRMEGRLYSDLVRTYGERLQEVLPLLQLALQAVFPAKDQEPIGGVLFEEEDDDELVSIFLDSFRENLAELASLTPFSPGSPLVATSYEQARTVFKRMISSASYMDYDPVVHVLKEWDARFCESQRSGQSNGQFYSDILGSYGERLRELLPALQIPAPPFFVSKEASEPEEKEDEELLTIFVDSLEQNFSELLSLSPLLPESTLGDAHLERARELIKRSISSARYMDYDHVVSALKEWDESLVESQKSGRMDGRSYADLLNIHGQRLKAFIPALKLSPEVFDSGASPEAVPQINEGEDKELLEIFLASFQQDLSELASLAPPSPEAFLSSAALERVGDLFKRSVSSAHYMDYGQIVAILKEWEESLCAACRSGPTSGRIYSGMLGRYAQSLQEVLHTLTSEVVPFPARGDQDDTSAVRGDSSNLFLGMFEEPLPLPLVGSLVLDLSREPETVADEMSALLEESRIQESPPPLEAQTKQEEPSSGKGSGAVVTLRVNVQKVDQLLNQVMELVIRRSEFADTAASFRGILREFTALGRLSKEDLKKLRAIGLRLNESTLSLGRVATELQHSVMQVRMLPISQLFMRFPRVIRDQALKLGKKAELIVEGEETEIDKRILEQMYDPLVQFLRNAMVHGIESPAKRTLAGKPEQGIIRLSAYQEGDYVVLDIEDDGQGIDTRKLVRVLKEDRKMRSYDLDRLSNEELIQAIFLPGVSTHGSVDGTAGRGVGLDVVKENVERMNGTIAVESEPGVGTRFTVRIPLTVAVIRALLVKGANQVFALPLNAISQILSYRHEDIHTIEGFQVIQQRGKTIPLVRLSQLVGVQDEHPEGRRRFIVLVATTFREVGLIVDGLLGDREIVIKPIEDEQHTFEGFSGATILGDGTVSLILDVSTLVKKMKSRWDMAAKHETSPVH